MAQKLSKIAFLAILMFLSPLCSRVSASTLTSLPTQRRKVLTKHRPPKISRVSERCLMVLCTSYFILMFTCYVISCVYIPTECINHYHNNHHYDRRLYAGPHSYPQYG